MSRNRAGRRVLCFGKPEGRYSCTGVGSLACISISYTTFNVVMNALLTMGPFISTSLISLVDSDGTSKSISTSAIRLVSGGSGGIGRRRRFASCL